MIIINWITFILIWSVIYWLGIGVIKTLVFLLLFIFIILKDPGPFAYSKVSLKDLKYLSMIIIFNIIAGPIPILVGPA